MTGPARPPAHRPLRVDPGTGPRQLAARVALGEARTTTTALLLLGGAGLADTAVPVLAGVVVDRALVPGDAGALAGWSAALAAVLAAAAWAARAGARAAARAEAEGGHRLRTQLAEALLGGHPPRVTPGELVRIAATDVDRLGRAAAMLVWPPVEVLTVLACAGVLVWVSPGLGLAVVVGAVVLLTVAELGGAPLRRRAEEQQATAGAAAGAAADWIAGAGVLAGLGAAGTASAREAAVRAARAEGAYRMAMQAATGLFVAAVAGAAGLLAISGGIGTGRLVTAVGVTVLLLSPLQELAANAGAVWARAVASAARVLTVLASAGPAQPLPERTGAPGLVLGAGVTAAAGECVGVLVDEDSTTGVLTGTWRGRPLGPPGCVVTPRHPAVFAGTVAANVGPPHRVAAALHAAAADDVVAGLPEGVHTQLDDGARRLSGGQRQRLALARAVAADPEVLVLVEPTTALDPVTEAQVVDRVLRARQGRTTVVLSTSAAWLSACDRVVHVTDGRVLDAGTHAELLARSTAYRAALL